MEEFEVMEPLINRSGLDREFTVFAIRFREPTFARILSSTPLKARSGITIENDNAMADGKYVGRVEEIRSSRDVRVNIDFDVKYQEGYSIDGVAVYLDSMFPRSLNVDGLLISTVETIGLHHKLPEKWLINSGYDYAYAHDFAVRIEKRYVESLGVKWKNYLREVDSKLSEVYKDILRNSRKETPQESYLHCRILEGLE